VPGVEGEAAVRRAGALDDREGGGDVVHLDVIRHELVDDLRVRVSGSVLAELAEALHDLVTRTRCPCRPDVVGGEGLGRPNKKA
jgi:hypothetical protein